MSKRVDRIPIKELQVTGYADELPSSMVPTVVPPVFQSKAEPNRVFLPPYHMSDGYLYGSTEVQGSEMSELASQGELTLFGVSYDAQPDYELWVDLDFIPHYELHDEAMNKLREISGQFIGRAIQALKNRTIEEADRLGGVAAAAFDRHVAPFAIKGAIRRFQGNRVGEQLMEDLAPKATTVEEFRKLVDYYFQLIPSAQFAVRPMCGVATMHAAL